MAAREEVLEFSIKGSLGHFRQPDTTATHATYPFPPRPTIHGLLASVLGLSFDGEAGEGFLQEDHFVGFALVNPVRTVCAQMSMHGKGFIGGGGDSFNRLTTIELVVAPHYLVYYAGSRLLTLAERVQSRQSIYHTYLGSAYCLTFPIFQGLHQVEEVLPEKGSPLLFSSVVPQKIVEDIIIEHGGRYAIARALPYRHTGGRLFEQTVNVLYEVSGSPLKIVVKETPPIPCKFIRLPGGRMVCLW
jgi:CRISPR-associated protein Cas5h